MISSEWQWKKLFLSFSLISVALLSLYSPLWNRVDTAFFTFFNTLLANSSWLRTFFSFTSHDIVDWVEDGVFALLFISAVLVTAGPMRGRRSAELLFCILFTALTILLINRFVCRDFLRLRRASPSLTLASAFPLSDLFDGIKTGSTKSFPGDHATLALMLSLSYGFFVRGRLGIVALSLGLFLCLPRLAIGAHWLSDIAVGSCSIVLFSLSLAFFTPLAAFCVSALEQLFGFLLPKKGLKP